MKTETQDAGTQTDESSLWLSEIIAREKRLVEDSLIPACVSQIRDDGKNYFIWCNRALINLLEYTEEELYALSFEAFMVQDSSDQEEQERAAKYLKAKPCGPNDAINCFRKKNGSVITLAWHTTQDDKDMFYSQLIDITNLVNVEERDRRKTILIDQLLPEIIANQVLRIDASPTTISQRYDNVSVLFADISGFTDISRQASARDIFKTLKEVYRRVDVLVEKYDFWIVKYLGDGFMIVGGAPKQDPLHALKMVQLGIDLLTEFANKKFDICGQQIKLRIGIHSGPVMGGVISEKRPGWDIVGETVNKASRMESYGQIGAITLSEETMGQIPSISREYFPYFYPRVIRNVKGYGLLRSFQLWPNLLNTQVLPRSRLNMNFSLGPSVMSFFSQRQVKEESLLKTELSERFPDLGIKRHCSG